MLPRAVFKDDKLNTASSHAMPAVIHLVLAVKMAIIRFSLGSLAWDL